MKRQRENTESFVYAYGCGNVLNGEDWIDQEAELCAELWDRLVDIDRQFEREIEAAAAKDDSELAAMLEDISTLGGQIAAAKESGDKALVKTLADQRRAVRRSTWEPLKAWRRAHKEKLKEINKKRIERITEARQSSGLYWGNYNAVIQRYETARTAVRQTGRRLRYHDRDRDDACLTVQIQRTRSGLGAAPAELQNGSFSAVQVGYVDPRAYDIYVPRGQRRRLCQSKIQLRVDAAGNMATLNIWLDRPLPDNARVKQVQLTRRKVGKRYKYQACFTLSRPAPTFSRTGDSVTIRIAPHLSEGGDIVVAETSRGERITLDRDWMESMNRVDRLPALIADESLPAKLRINWELERPGLWRRLLLRRREQYRLSAKRIAERYADIRIETPRLADMAMLDRGTVENNVRHRACAHNLIAEIRNQARKYGCTVAVEVASSEKAPQKRKNKKLGITSRDPSAAGSML